MDNFDLRKYLTENKLNEGFEKSAIQNALKANGYNLKQKDFKVSSKKKGNITHYYLNGEEIGNSEYNYDKFISKATKRIKEDPKKYGFKESLNEDTQSELDKWEGILYDLENMTKSSNNPDPIKQKKAIDGVKKKIASLKKKSEMNEIKGFEEFKETGFKLGDKVKFMGSAHPTHTQPIKLTGTIEYFEPADEIGIRVDGYGTFIPFFEIPSSIESINEDVESGKAYVVIPFYSDGITINENDVRVFTSYGKADDYFNTLQGSPIIVDTSID